jgi:hypothetical protein
VQAQPTISQLLSAADFPGALELIASAQQLLKEELKGVAALTPIGEGMVATKAVIEVRGREGGKRERRERRG